MARDFAKEAAWQKEKYEQFKFQVDKELGLAFRNRLKLDGIKVTDWFRQTISDMLQVPVDENIRVPVDEGRKNRRFTEDEIQEMLKLYNQGKTYVEIGKLCNRDNSAVRKLIKRVTES